MVNGKKQKQNKKQAGKRTGMQQLMAAYRANPPNRTFKAANRAKQSVSLGKTITMNANSVSRNIASSGRVFACADRERAGVLKTNASPQLNVPFTSESGLASPTSTYVFQINPGLKTYWPRLATISTLYNEYRVKSIKIELVPVMSEYNLSATSGRWIIAYNPDPADPLRTNPTSMSVLPSVTGQITAGGQFVVPSAALDKSWHYVRREGLGDASSITDYDLGNLFVATYGCADDLGNSHEIFVSYDVELRQPVLNSDGVGSSYDILTDRRWLVNNTSPDLNSSVVYGFYEAAGGLTSVKFNAGLAAGTFNGAITAVDSSGMNNNGSGASTLGDSNWVLPGGLYKVSGSFNLSSLSPIDNFHLNMLVAGTSTLVASHSCAAGYGPLHLSMPFSTIVTVGSGNTSSLDFVFAATTYAVGTYKLGSSGTYGTIPASWIEVECLSSY